MTQDANSTQGQNPQAGQPSQNSSNPSGGFVKGIAIALVTQNKDPEGLCRVKVRYPWHDKPADSYWARLTMPMAGKDRGLVLIPEVGDEVVVGFEREDLRFPYVLGALWNGQDKPPIANDDGKNDKRILKSRKKHYLCSRMERRAWSSSRTRRAARSCSTTPAS